MNYVSLPRRTRARSHPKPPQDSRVGRGAKRFGYAANWSTIMVLWGRVRFYGAGYVSFNRFAFCLFRCLWDAVIVAFSMLCFSAAYFAATGSDTCLLTAGPPIQRLDGRERYRVSRTGHPNSLVMGGNCLCGAAPVRGAWLHPHMQTRQTKSGLLSYL